MIRICLLFLFFYFYLVVSSRSNILILLILIEFIILTCFVQLRFLYFSYIVSLFFVLIGVCIGAYSICVFIFLYRSKTSSYILTRGLELSY